MWWKIVKSSLTMPGQSGMEASSPSVAVTNMKFLSSVSKISTRHMPSPKLAILSSFMWNCTTMGYNTPSKCIYHLLGNTRESQAMCLWFFLPPKKQIKKLCIFHSERRLYQIWIKSCHQATHRNTSWHTLVNKALILEPEEAVGLLAKAL